MVIASKIVSFLRKCGTNDAFYGLHVSSSHFHKNFAMGFFDLKIWINAGQNLVETFSSKIGFKNIFSFKVLSFFRDHFYPIIDVEKTFEPNHDGFINRCEFKNGSMHKRKRPAFSFDSVNVKAPISINVSSQISKICFHNANSITTVYTKSQFTVNDLAEERDLSRCESLISSERMRGNVEELPRPLMGHKSNSLPVLNSAAARLGQALRETQDALVRDQLESSASVINCVNGGNGDLPTEMAIQDVDDVVTVLQNNSGEYITSIVEADLKFGTAPIGDSYGCMLTTRMIPVLNNISGFIRKFQYPRNIGVFKPALIDLELLRDNKGEDESHAERLNEWAA